MKIRSKKVALVNAIGALGYTGVLLSWTILFAVVFLVAASGSLMVPTTITTQSSAPGHISVIISILLAVVAAVITIILLAMLLIFIGRGGSWFIRKTLAICHITHTKSHVWLAKAIFDVLPVICFSFLTYFGLQSELIVPLYVSIFFISLVSLALFSAQYLIASRLKITSTKIW